MQRTRISTATATATATACVWQSVVALCRLTRSGHSERMRRGLPRSPRRRTRIVVALGLAAAAATALAFAQETPTDAGAGAAPAEVAAGSPETGWPALGLVSVAVVPDDAEIRIASAESIGAAMLGPIAISLPFLLASLEDVLEPYDQSATPFLPASDYLLQVTRPGYLPEVTGFTVEAGASVDVQVQLERSSSVIHLRTAPADAEVLIDGKRRRHGSPAMGSNACRPPDSCSGEQTVEQFLESAESAEHRIDGLPAPGTFDLEVAREGFRSYRAVLQLPDLRDYELPDVTLAPEEAVISFVGLPEDAVIQASGDTLPVDRTVATPEIALLPGAYELTVRHAHGHFETSVVLTDRQRLEVDVELRPALAVLGLSSLDPATAHAVRSAVDFLRGLQVYTLLTEPLAADLDSLQELGIDPAALRGRPGPEARVMNWTTIRQRLHRLAPAALYVIAVPNDEQAANRVDLWWLSAAPGPAIPDVRSLRIRNGLADPDDLHRLGAALRPELDRRAPRIGVTLVESLAEGPLVVADVELASPAYLAGIEPGMLLVGVGDRHLSQASEWTAAVSALQPGDTLNVYSQGPDGLPVSHLIEPTWGWSVLDPFGPELLPAAMAAHLVQELKRPGDVPTWLIQLDLAAILTAQGDLDGAVRLLRSIEAPGRAGLGRETVRYLIGLALSELAEQGNPAYGDQAITAFRNLELAENGRLWSDRGPSIATRARLHARTSLALVPPEAEIVVGQYRADVLVGGMDIAALRFLVDGKLQTTRSRSHPWAMLHLARYPKEQVVRVEGLNGEGQVVASDELVLNRQQGELRVRIEEPPQGVHVSGTTQARAAVVAPKGRQVGSVVFQVGDEVQAELRRPPWQAEISVPEDSGAPEPAYLTVTATLDDGSHAEDVRFLSASILTDHVDVDLVELYTTVIDQANRPVTGLQAGDFTVFEDGRRQEVARFELVRNLPLTLGAAIDTSASMKDVIEETRQAAARFLTNLIKPQDRSFAVAFASRPHLLTGLTSDVAMVVDTIRSLRTTGNTALHDALMTSLYYFRGVAGRRALVLLSDGEDTSSSASYADVLEYARHSEIVIYAIGLGIGSTQPLLRAKLEEIATVTGGRAFFIKAARDLTPVYRQIDRELRSQYLLAYNSNREDAGEDFRQVEVRVTENRRARTISGYYP